MKERGIIKVINRLHERLSILDCNVVNQREKIGINANFILFDWLFFTEKVKDYDNTVKLLKYFQQVALDIPKELPTKNIIFTFEDYKVKVTAYMKDGFKILTFKGV